PIEEFNLKDDSQDRPYAIISADNKVAIGTVPDYGKTGGSLAFFNPKTGDYESYRNIVEGHSIVSLLYEGDYIFGGTSVYGCLGAEHTLEEDDKLFIWDTKSNKIVFETEPLSGEKSIPALTLDGEGNLYGFTAGKMFKFDLDKKEVIDSREYYHMEWEN